MLFLQALVSFMLGISVVAIPITPMISDISPRDDGKPEGQTPSEQHSLHDTSHHHGGNAWQLQKPEDGLWSTSNSPRRGRYTKPVSIPYFMKIVNGDIVDFEPKPSDRIIALNQLFMNKVWFREEELKLAVSVSDFPLFENPTSYMPWSLYRGNFPMKCLKDLTSLLSFLLVS
jgi:hypothetical protein